MFSLIKFLVEFILIEIICDLFLGFLIAEKTEEFSNKRWAWLKKIAKKKNAK